MTKAILLGSAALATVALAIPGTLLAQTATPTAEQCQRDPGLQGCTAEGEAVQLVTVTGSRIARPNLSSSTPVISVAGEDFLEEGPSSVGDTLNELPQLRSTFAQQNPGAGIGIAGLNVLDLRGLGPTRTLVLVNGRRHVAGDIASTLNVDVTTIPSDLIQRTDIVTGGNSAVYGSDALAGVVNFVLRRDFEGFQFRSQFGVAGDGYGAGGQMSAMWGQNFDDDRGNITVHGEFGHQTRIFASDVPWLNQNDGFVVVDVDTPGLANGSDGVPDRTFLRNLRSTTISQFTLVPVTQPAGGPICGMGLGPTNGPAGTAGGVPYNCTFVFDAAGNVAAQTGERRGTGINSAMIGGNGVTGRDGDLLSVIPRLDRYNFNVLSRYGFSELAEVFFEGKFSRTFGRGNNAGPTFIQSTLQQFDIRERIRLDNPFLNPAARTTLANAILASGCNNTFLAACVTPAGAPIDRGASGGQGIQGPLNAADRAAINAGTYRIAIGRNLLDAGIRDEEFTRDTVRFVAGLRGTFNEDWSYEVSFNYGRYNQNIISFGFVDRQRFMLSLDAGRNPVTGQIQCRSQFDAASATAFTQGLSAATAAANQAKLAADIAACVPYNPFGAGDNAAAARYFEYSANNNSEITQSVVSAFVSGDSSQLFSLQGGPIGFAIGGELRVETALTEPDVYVQTGATNSVVFPPFTPPSFRVSEIFAELRLPLLADLPFAHELTVSGAGRRSQYSAAIGEVDTYNYGFVYAPMEDFRVRVNVGRAVRAPNLLETGRPLVPNFANGNVDPCASNQIANNPNRQANCQADLGPLLAGLPNIARSLPVLSGANPLLNAEQSDSLTYGFVFQPRFIDGLSLSVDYYDIDVSNVIVSLSAQQIMNLCYDQPNLNNQFCGLFSRWRGPGNGPLNETPGQVLGNSLIQAGVNFARRTRRGVDLQLTYEREFGQDWSFEADLVYTHNEQISNYNNPVLPNFEDRVLRELGDPEDEFRLGLELGKGGVTLGYSMRYIGPAVINEWEDTNPLPTACSTPTNCPPNNLDWADVLEYESVVYHGLRIQYDFNSPNMFGDRVRVFAGVENLADTTPPLGLTGVGSGSAIYDVRGRVFYAGLRTRF